MRSNVVRPTSNFYSLVRLFVRAKIKESSHSKILMEY